MNSYYSKPKRKASKRNNLMKGRINRKRFYMSMNACRTTEKISVRP